MKYYNEALVITITTIRIVVGSPALVEVRTTPASC